MPYSAACPYETRFETMHPIFRKRRWFAAYMILWAALAVMLSALLAQLGALVWREAVLLAAPLCLFYAFASLTPWYVCRQLPLASTHPARLAAYHASAAILATALWIGLARAVAGVAGI